MNIRVAKYEIAENYEEYKCEYGIIIMIWQRTRSLYS